MKKHKSKSAKIRRREKLKKELKLCFLIAIICLVLSFGLAVITGKIPSFLEKTIQRQVERVAGEKKKQIEKEIKKAGRGDVDDILKKYKDKIKNYR
jgi:glutamine amidotransferase-like uncharacterized protein